MATRTIPRARKRITIFGAYGGINAGDEMILRALVDRINREAGSPQSIRVIVDRLPDDPARTVDYEGRSLAPISFRTIMRSLVSTWGSDLVIGGGQIIDGVNGVKLPLLQLGQAVMAKTFRRQSINPWCQ